MTNGQVIREQDILNPDGIKEELNTKIIGKEVYCFQETGSTQMIARRLADGGAREGTVVSSEEQTKGKGRMGRSWLSPRGKGIWISVILRPPISPERTGRISLASALAVAEAIREIAGLPALIKWPNDLLIGGKKVGGVLIEMTAERGLVKFIILGIGVNVNQDKFPPELKGIALSLKQEGGEEVSRLALLREILRRLDNYYLSLNGGGFEVVANRWRELSATLGRQVKVSFQGKIVEGQATDIDVDGALLLRLDSGFIKRLIGGEVTIFSSPPHQVRGGL